ncbi:GNAT family N-acetyltransferase [Paeniglutamicibacter kerguelensis]|uniref:RimJ/RimL family protein N-acetyltransferase n=1 Tax=Paeniglutamicibacter kerguelensis TaxID=254788 RepID=A0ABS4XF11_9MICC|nr:GNAT family N-acetyltransferase [Paeniglutamicibacter kerguelensis]MBP2387062.1 RimJ/RimL family protein N-acetyltransferase [Paeniglutamicibacter kerguelensis]
MTALHLPDADPAYLRPWTDSETDVEAILAAFDSEDMAGQAGEPVGTIEAALRWVSPWLDPLATPGVAFAIDMGGLAVGNVMATAIDKRHETAWVSYWVSPHARGRGLASAATAGLAEHCFHELGLYRLELAHRVNNPGSGRVAVKAGFVAEGTERGKLKYLDEYGRPVRFDVRTFARLRDDPSPRLVPLRVGN